MIRARLEWTLLTSSERVSRSTVFIKPFKGNFKGCSYDAPRSPFIQLSNSKICERFQDFIAETVLEWVTAGVLMCGVGLVRWPTSFGSSPRCGALKAPSLSWQPTFKSLDKRPPLLAWSSSGLSAQICSPWTLCHSSSLTYFGLEWLGMNFAFCTLPFG